MKRLAAAIVHNWPLKLAAIGVAVLLYAGLVLAQNAQRWDGRIPIVPRGQPVEAVLLGMQPAEVTEVRFFAPAEVAARVSSETFIAVADLSGVDPAAGETYARVEVTASDPRITILDYQPTTVRVALDPLVTRTVPIEVDLGEVPPDLQVGEPILEAEEAVASGPESVVRLIDRAVASVTIQPSGLDIDEDVRLVPVDALGDSLSPVDLDPEVVRVRVRVGTSIDSKVVPVSPVTTGTPAAGFVVSSVSVEPATVTVSGDSDALAELPAVETAPVSIAGARTQVTATVALAPPVDVELIGTQEVTVTVVIEPAQASRTYASGLVLVGAEDDRIYRLSTSQVLVTIGGNVADLDRLDPTSFVASLDVTNLGPGTHAVDVSVLNLPAGLTVASISPPRVTVDVELVAPSPTPTPTATPTPTPSP